MLSYSSYAEIGYSLSICSVHDGQYKAHQLNIGPHLGNLSDLDHDQFIDLGILLLIVPHVASVVHRVLGRSG